MLFAVALAMLAAPADWVPMRWTGADPKALELLNNTPVNCLLVEAPDWQPAFLDAAASKGLAVLGVLRPKQSAEPPRGLAGLVLEGDWIEPPQWKAPVIVELPPRNRIRFDSGAPIIGTYQAVWPGIQVQPGGSAKAAPSGGPWIDTNSGFVRFARAASDAAIWIANTPPPGSVITAERYLQVIADAGIMGARWVVALDDDLRSRLWKREPEALRTWKRMSDLLAWFESHREWRAYQPAGQLALVQDVASGALYSGGVLDMITVKHTPVLAVPGSRLSKQRMEGAKLAVNVDPAALTPEQKEVLRSFSRSGGTVLNGPPGWRFPPMSSASITLSAEEVKKLDEIWKELNGLTGRRNLGARLFNVSSMLSNLLRSPDGKATLLHLVNYSGYPVENVTVHVLGRFRAATLVTPGAPPKKLEVYEIEEGAGTGVDIDEVGVYGTVVLEPAAP